MGLGLVCTRCQSRLTNEKPSGAPEAAAGTKCGVCDEPHLTSSHMAYEAQKRSMDVSTAMLATLQENHGVDVLQRMRDLGLEADVREPQMRTKTAVDDLDIRLTKPHMAALETLYWLWRLGACD